MFGSFCNDILKCKVTKIQRYKFFVLREIYN